MSAKANIPNHITVGTYNLFGLRNEKDLKKDLNVLSNVDIWAFQEVEDTFTGRTEERLANLLAPGKWYIYTQKVNVVDANKRTWEGQAIASRFPIDSTEIVPLNHTDKKDRVALIAHFRSDSGQNFAFTNTDHEVELFSIDFKDRKKQLESLVEHYNKTDTAAVITGDFNTTGGNDEIAKTEDVLSKAGFARATPFDEDSYTFQKLFIKKELDHFFSRGVTTSERYRYSERKGSDHFPVYIEVNL